MTGHRCGRNLASHAACCLMLLAASLSGMATELRVAAQEGTEPKFIASDQGIVGLCIDIMRAIERVDPGLKFVGDQHWMPLIRVYSEAANGKQDAVCGVQDTPERRRHYVFLDP